MEIFAVGVLQEYPCISRFKELLICCLAFQEKLQCSVSEQNFEEAADGSVVPLDV
jgi:hypothetical protein